MALTEPSQFTTQKKKQAYTPVVFINFDDPDQYWASRFIDVSEDVASSANWSDGAGADYEDVLALNSIGGVSQSVARFGGLATLGGVTVKLINLGYADFLATNPYLEGQEVEIFLVFDDGTPLVFSESLQIFTGLVETFGVDESRLTVTLSPPELIGEFTFTEHTDDPTVPFSYAGEKFPVVYGDHSRYMNRLLDASITNLQAGNNMVEAQLMGTAPDESTLLEIYYKLADTELYEFDEDDIWIEDPVTGRLWNVDASSVNIGLVSTTGDPVVLVIQIDTTAKMSVWDFVFADSVEDDATNTSDWNDSGDAGDQENDTAATLRINSPAGAWHYGFDVKFSEIQYGDNVDLPTQYQVYSRSASVDTHHPYIITAAGSQSISGYANTRYYNSGYSNNLSDGVAVVAAGSGTGSTFDCKIYEIFKRVDLDLDFNQEEYRVFVGCKGTKDDSSGTYTGTANALIENPIHMLHHIAINYFNKATADLDTSISDDNSTLAVLRDSWKFSKIYTETESFKDLVTGFAEKGLFFAWLDNLNKLKGRAIRSNSTEPYSISNTYTPTDADTVSDSPTVASGSIAKHWAENIRPANKTNIKDWANDVTLEYFFNHYTEEAQLTDNDTDSNSITEYGETITKTVQNEYIRDTTTAGYYLAIYLELVAYRNWYVSGSGRLDMANFELGDIIDIDFVWDGILSSEDRIWQIIDITKNIINGIGRVNFKAVERIVF